jgi:hypothetical protein
LRAELLRAPLVRFDPDDLRDAVEARFAAERDFDADLEPPRFVGDLRVFDPCADERFVDELFADDFLAPELFDEELLPPRAAERELFAPDLRAAVDFFAPLLRDVLLLALFLAAFEPEPPFLPPPSCLLTVAQARRSASSSGTPRLS